MKKNNLSVSSKVYRLINYGPVVLVSSAAGKKRNIATIAWSTPLSSEPVLIGVAIYKGHFSPRLIAKSKEFAVNVPPAGLLKKVKKCGSVHGNKIDKFDKFGLTPLRGKKVQAPLIAECYAHLECKVIKTVKTGDHFLYVGKVVAASVNKGLLTSGKTVNVNKVKTLHHLGGEEFGTLKRV